MLGSKTVITLSILRLVFIGTTIGIPLEAAPASVFGSDWFKILNMAGFAISNGYVST